MINLFCIRPKGFNVGNDAIYLGMQHFVYKAFGEVINLITLPAQSKHLQHLRLQHYYYRVGTNRIAVPEKYTDRYRGGFVSRLADLARSLPSMAQNRQRAREEWFLFKQTNRHHFPRPIPPYQFYNGSQWWTMSASSARYVLSTYTSLFNDHCHVFEQRV